MKAAPASLVLAAALLLGALLNSALCMPPGRQTITSAALRDAGITRTTDLLWLADNWHLSTIDGYTWRAAVNGLNTLDDQAWIVFLDGQRMNLKTFDVINLNVLPVALDHIDSVVFISSPQLHFGEFTDKGLIHIYTRRPGPGISASGNYYGGNETGDPGPHLYTPYRTPNVDRAGLDESLTIDASRDNWAAQFFLLWQTHTFSDFAQYQRARSTTNKFAVLSLWSTFCRLGWKTARGEHELLAGYSYGDKHRIFFNPYGREIPVINLSPHIGLNGSLSTRSGALDLLYRLQFARNSLGESTNLHNFDFGYSLQNINAVVLGKFRTSALLGHIGIGIDHYLLDASPQLADPSWMIGKIFGELRGNWLHRQQTAIGSMLLASNGKIALKTSLSNLWVVNPGNRLSISIAFSQRLLEEDNSLWYWVQQGYRVFENNSAEYSISGNWDQSARITADVAWSHNIRKDLAATAVVFYRHLDGLHLESYSYQFLPDACAFTSPASALGGLNGKIGGISLTLSKSLERVLNQDLFYMYQTTLGGSQQFCAACDATPRHRAGFRITWVPFDNVSVWAMISYRSSAVYRDYQNAGSQTCSLSNLINPVYSPALKSTTIFDLSMKKWFWKRRISGQIILRNVMNRDLRYHPVGAGFGLSMLVQVDALLGAAPR